MTEPKKDDKKGGKKDAKPAAGGGNSVEFEILFGIFVIVMIVFVVIPRLFGSFGVDITAGGVSGFWASTVVTFRALFSAFFSTLTFVSVFACLILILGIFYAKFKLNQLILLKSAGTSSVVGGGSSSISNNRAAPPVPGVMNLPGQLPGQSGSSSASITAPVPVENPRWKDVQKHMTSSNQSDWRLAIIEADIMLYDMLDQMGYEGDSIGDKLKKVEPQSFSNLDDAWRAHKIRNIIAHEGGNYVLSRFEADRTIECYRRVFAEFYYI